MTTPAGWWCPTCGHTQPAPVADQPDPTQCDECETIGQNCRAHRNRPVGVPVGDDTPAPRFVYGEDSFGSWMQQVGDDTPAPTAQWTVDDGHCVYGPNHEEIICFGVPGADADEDMAQWVADALNRAGAAPDLTAGEVLNKVWLSLENVAASPRDVLLAVLDEEGPEGLIQAVLDAAAALVREDTDQ
jgi:hypothetical protein